MPNKSIIHAYSFKMTDKFLKGLPQLSIVHSHAVPFEIFPEKGRIQPKHGNTWWQWTHTASLHKRVVCSLLLSYSLTRLEPPKYTHIRTRPKPNTPRQPGFRKSRFNPQYHHTGGLHTARGLVMKNRSVQGSKDHHCAWSASVGKCWTLVF